MTKLSDFDLDFSFGQEGENLVNELLTGGKTVEVKRDRKWYQTGNLYIETECWSNESKSWVNSGLLTTKAEYWAFVLETGVVMVTTKCVAWTVQRYGHRIECSIEPNYSRGFLITAENLFDMVRKMR